MGKSIYFTDDELVEVQTAVEHAHPPTDAAEKQSLRSAHLKLARALGLPWATRQPSGNDRHS